MTFRAQLLDTLASHAPRDLEAQALGLVPIVVETSGRASVRMTFIRACSRSAWCFWSVK